MVGVCVSWVWQVGVTGGCVSWVWQVGMTGGCGRWVWHVPVAIFYFKCKYALLILLLVLVKNGWGCDMTGCYTYSEM